MAEQGTQFTNFHVAQAVCSASRAALLTGCYSNRVGIHGALFPQAKIGLADSELTLPEMLKQQGYATAAVGKWHLGDRPVFLPTRHGFDHFYGLPFSNDMWPQNPNNKNFSQPLPFYDDETIIDPEVNAEDQEQLTTKYTEEAVKFIQQKKTQAFFLYLAHSMPHVPLYVSSKFKGKSGAGLYADVIMEIDWSVGQIMNVLDEVGVAENTWLIFTSDNGPWLSYGNHAGSAKGLREGKTTAWQGGVKVPCLMRWPGKIPAGQINERMLMTIDLLPTIAGKVGAKPPQKQIDGKYVWPLICGEKEAKNPHEHYFFYYAQNELQAVASADGAWKLQLPHSYQSMEQGTAGKDGMSGKSKNERITQAELYDLRQDPGERVNVAAANPEVVKSLEAAAEQMRSDLGDALLKVSGTGQRGPGKVE
jgi:arylsulfatase